MRVVHVITRLIVGGAQENTVSTVLGLLQKPDTEVELLSGPSEGPEGSMESVFDRHPGVLKHIPDLVRPVHPLKDLNCLRHLARCFRENRPDIVHTHSGKAGILGRLAAKRAGVPIIIHTIHGPSFGPFQGALANLIFTTAEKIAARHTTHFISVAQAMTNQYLDAGIGTPERYSRIFSGFRLEPFLQAENDLSLRRRLGLKETDVVIGKIARLFELKGHDDLFAIAPSLISHNPNIKFLFVGDGILRPKFEAQARDLGLKEHFVFTGLVPPSEVPRYVGIMDFLVHLSRREGLPRALPQALAAARPVIAYDCDGAPEICLDDQTGFLVPLGDHQLLLEKILLLARDAALRQRLGLHGQEFVRENFAEQRMVDSIFDLYHRLLKPLPK